MLLLIVKVESVDQCVAQHACGAYIMTIKSVVFSFGYCMVSQGINLPQVAGLVSTRGFV